ncbi:MAG: hypothetical protein J1D77_02650 [Muribaculaceae bacterium]|nr:hypothetical protein [Muribaculaceae bacterium]
MKLKHFLYFLAIVATVGSLSSCSQKGGGATEKDSIDKNKLIAHRGLWSQGYPQNSKEGIEAAVVTDLGGYECDIRQTADGFIILNHDMEVGDKDIDKSSLEELRAEAPEILPLLSDILEIQSRHPEKIMYAEIKSGNVEDILAVFKEKGIDKNVIFKSFDKEICLQLIGQTAMPVYLLSGDNNLDFQELKKEGFSGVSLMFKEGETNKALIDNIHSTGLNCAFWTVNDPDVAKQLDDWGADHVVSDLTFLEVASD